jgi:glutathione S-transferase
MKLYDFTRAPSPRRVRIFAAEKGLSIPSEQVDILSGKARTPEFLAINPAGGLPVLQLDDASYLAESDAIALYLERLHPEPNLLGRDAKEQATILMWERRTELNLYVRVLHAFQHGHPLSAARVKKQIKEYAEFQRDAIVEQLAWMNEQLKGRLFVAGPRFTIADITALVTIDFGRLVEALKLDPSHKELARWYEAVSHRPSAAA